MAFLHSKCGTHACKGPAFELFAHFISSLYEFHLAVAEHREKVPLFFVLSTPMCSSSSTCWRPRILNISPLLALIIFSWNHSLFIPSSIL